MILGVDIGGTNTRMGLVSENFTLDFPCEIVKSLQFAYAEKPIDTLAGLLSAYVNQHSVAEVSAISIGVPAAVSNDFSTVYCAPNLKNRQGKPVFDGISLGKRLKEYLHVPVFVNKDVNLLLYYDIYSNQLGGTVVGCYIGTGLGTAVSINGHLLYGSNGFAMDAGHVPLFHQSDRCGCGKRGCAETVSSGSKLKQLHAKEFPSIPMSELFIKCGEHPLLEQFVADCAYVPATLVTIFNPSALVLGGGVVEMDGFPRKRFEREILALSGRAVASVPPEFIYAEKMPERGVVGAACFAQNLLVEIDT